MSFVHKNAEELADLVQIVAGERGLRRSIVEKDYWVTHTLWALSQTGLDIWFKGGTSLSKGFGIIERFSEDLDLKIDPGAVTALPHVSNWKSDRSRPTSERRAFFEQLPAHVAIPDCRVELELDTTDKLWRNANLRVVYPGLFLAELPAEVSGSVRLEVGNARVTPHVARPITSWIHDKLASTNLLAAYQDNRAAGVRCVHPFVTLIEKLDALHRRFPNERSAPAMFVRHYEDVARLIDAVSTLPPLDGYPAVRALADEMLAQRQIVAMPSADDPALAPTDNARWDGLRSAHAAIGDMFWGPRLSLEDASARIRSWIAATLC